MEQRLERKIDELCSHVEQLDHSIRGNGQPGILTRLAVHDERINSLSQFAEEVHGFKRWVVLGVISLIASMLVQSLGLIP
jgi:hypothetical protein